MTADIIRRLKVIKHATQNKRWDSLEYAFKPWSTANELQIAGLTIPLPEHSGRRDNIIDQCFHFVKDKTFAFFQVQNPKVIIDCGASYGIVAANYAVRFPQARVVAFEPNPAAYKYGRELLEKNGLTRVELHNKAVSDKKGKSTLFVNLEHFESASLTQNVINESGEKIEIECEDIVEFLRRENVGEIDLIKIDIEGAEFSLMQHISDQGMLSKIKNIFLEIHLDYQYLENTRFSSILKLLEDQQFYYKIVSTGSDDRHARYLLWASQTPIRSNG